MTIPLLCPDVPDQLWCLVGVEPLSRGPPGYSRRCVPSQQSDTVSNCRNRCPGLLQVGVATPTPLPVERPSKRQRLESGTSAGP